MAVILYADMRAGYIVDVFQRPDQRAADKADVFQRPDQRAADKAAHRLAVLFGNIFLTIMIFMHLSIVIHSVPPINIRYIMRELC